MKANLLLNCSGLNPELISKRPRPDSVSIPCRCRVLTTLLLCLTLGVGQMWGASETYTFNSKSWGATNSSSATANWSGTKDGNQFNSSATPLGVQVCTGQSGVVVTCPDSYDKITKVEVVYSSSKNGVGSINVQVGANTALGAKSISKSQTRTTLTWTPSNQTGQVKITCNCTTNSYGINSVTITYRDIYVSKTSITGLDYEAGSGPSTAQSFTASGTNLSGNLTVTAPTNFEVSKTSSTSGFASSVSLTASSGTVSSTTIYVRLKSGLSAGTYGGASAYVTVSGGSATTKNVSVSGTVSSGASCSENPTIGNASLNGSISSSSIPLSISSVGGGTDCTLAEYGFVWKASSAPSASDNKTKIGESSSATSFTGNITGSFSTGVTYYIKGYAINNGPNTTLSSTALTITPQSVTFNSNGGSSVSTAYVNNGATVSKPSDPTKTGYTFGTWQLSGSDYNFSSNVTSDITLDATWNAKTTAITLNKNNDDASGSTAGSASYTYGESTKNSYTAATRTGYTLNGYYTATSAGTKILNADGTIAGNSIVVSTVTYTDGSGNWAYDGTSLTLYAQWTIKSYSVTWKVNNTDYTTGTPTSSVNHGSKVTKLPTAPDPGSYCGDKFMGWTDADGGVYTHGTSNLYTSASQFPAAEGAQTFYAVFADYDE